MLRFLKNSLLLCLLVTTFPALWSAMTAYDDVFDERGVLQVDASRLKNTCVSPHLEAPITEGGNVLWCGTFQLAWNELRTLIGEDLHFAGKEPEMVAVLNKRQFLKSDLDDASYVAVADFVRNDVHGRIQRELQRKFGGQASPKLLPSRADTPRPQDIVAYSYLFKNLEFPVVFERIEQPLRFGASRVHCFGIGDVFKPGQAPMYGQVRVLDFRSPDDFIVELRTKSEGDRVILAHTRPGKTLGETIAAVQDRALHGKPSPAYQGDVLKVPKFNFDITRSYQELLGAKLAVANPAVAKDLQVVAAAQNTRFQMDEKGVKLRSESHVSFGCAGEAPPPRKRVMVFDKPFLIMLQRSDAKMPYFALWVGNADLLRHADGN
jgi:hypothetical protein